MSGVLEGQEGVDGDLRDERLRRALAHAPDHGATPDWRTRKAILEQAREAVAPSLPAAPVRPARTWWRRLLGVGGSEGGGRMPWNAAFATVLVAVLVAVLWQREPVPGARLDSEAPVAAPWGTAAESPAAPAAPAAPPATAAPAAEPSPAPAQAPETVPAPQSSQANERMLPSSEDIPGTPLPPQEPAPPAAARPPAKAAREERPEAPVATPSEPARRQAEEAARAAMADRAKEARKREAPANQPAPPAIALSPAAPPAPAPSAARDAFEAPRPPPAAALAPAAPAPRAAEPAELPNFAALSQWSRMTITPRGGAGRSLSRGEAIGLNALLGSAALSAVGPQPLAGAVEWRVTLERTNGEVLATFEVGRNQVRWREGQKPATTGAPSAGSLAALRAALQQALEPPAAPPPLQWRPAQPPPGPAAEPTAAPEPAPPR